MSEENGAEEVVAEVIEEQGAPDLVVTYSPSVISANFDAMEDSIRAKVADYEGAKYDLTKDESIKEAKNDRLYLNGLKKEIEERRKAVKREYNKPLAAFEKRCKEITSIIDGASDGIKAQLDQAEEDRKSRAMAKLKEHYETFAELLAPALRLANGLMHVTDRVGNHIGNGFGNRLMHSGNHATTLVLSTFATYHLLNLTSGIRSSKPISSSGIRNSNSEPIACQ